MTIASYLPVNFSVSPHAWSEIDSLRRFWDHEQTDKADVAVVGWGTTKLLNGTARSHVFVSFYGRSERHDIEGAIQIVSGREIVFFILEKDYHIFDGMDLKFEKDRGFFLS